MHISAMLSDYGTIPLALQSSRYCCVSFSSFSFWITPSLNLHLEKIHFINSSSALIQSESMFVLFSGLCHKPTRWFTLFPVYQVPNMRSQKTNMCPKFLSQCSGLGE